MNLAQLALTGFFVWSNLATSSALTLPVPVVEAAEPAPKAVPVALVSEKTLSVMLTGYNALPEQTDGDPSTTASGAYSNPEVIAAVSEDLRYSHLPFGTIIKIEAENPTGPYCEYEAVEHLIGYRVVADVMNPRWKNMVDILLDPEDQVAVYVDRTRKKVNPARALGSCGNVTVQVVGKMKIKDIPATQSELALHVEKILAAK